MKLENGKNCRVKVALLVDRYDEKDGVVYEEEGIAIVPNGDAFLALEISTGVAICSAYKFNDLVYLLRVEENDAVIRERIAEIRKTRKALKEYA